MPLELSDKQLNFPKYDYTFQVTNTFFESGTIEVKYTPKDQSLISVTLAVPILADFDINNLASYLELWAPYSRWFSQEIFLKHEAALKNATQ